MPVGEGFEHGSVLGGKTPAARVSSQWKSTDRDLRVLVLAPLGRDASLAEQTLARAGLCPQVCSDLDQLCEEIPNGASAVLVAEEALPREGTTKWEEWIGQEPPWSSLPIILLLGRSTRADNVAALRRLERRPNVNFLERPVPKRTLISTVSVAVETRRLQYAIRDALESERIANRKKDEFLATLAHELRNPLAPIRNAIYVLQKTNGDDPAAQEQARPLLIMMQRQVEHLVRLIDDLLEVSRITSGKIELKKERCDLAAVLRHAIDTSLPLIKAAGQCLTVEKLPSPVMVEADPVRLAQVLTNLLNNAAKYTDGVGHIWVKAERVGDEAVIRVRDDGMGISPELLPHVFDLFTQSKRTLGRRQGGIGVGLYLSWNLVHLHGGQIEAHSDGPDRGSEFIVRLPAAETSPASGSDERGQAEGSSRPHRVLVVDDDQDVADSLVTLLVCLGADVCVAYGGESAVALISEFRPRLAFVDIGMPRMDGYETARRIRKLPEGRDLLLVALSGWGRDEDRQRAIDAGFDRHFVKPIEIEALQKLLADEPAGA